MATKGKKQDPMAAAVKRIMAALEPLSPKLRRATLDYVTVLLEEKSAERSVDIKFAEEDAA